MPLRPSWRTVALLAGLAFALPRAAAAQSPEGPPMNIAWWIARGPVPDPAPDVLQVIEVWATWCGPCHETFPVLTRLQREYADRIRVVALTDDPPDRVRRTFHANPEAMRFAIAVADSATTEALMFGDFGGRGLPSVFVIRDGQVLWGGEVAGLEGALARLLPPEPGPPAIRFERAVIP